MKTDNSKYLIYFHAYHNFSGTACGIKSENPLSRNMSSYSSYSHGILDVMINYGYTRIWWWMRKLGPKSKQSIKYCFSDL